MISVEKWEVCLCHSVKTSKEICNRREKYENLEEKKEKLVKEMLFRDWKILYQRKGKNKKTERWKSKTKYIDLEWKLGDSQRSWNSTPQNKTSTNRKLKEPETQAQKPLNLVEIIGLDLQLLKLKDPNSTNSFSIDFSTTNPPDPQPEHGSVAFRKSNYE